MWNRRQGTFLGDPTDSSYAYPHYHGSSPMRKKYISYDGMERFQHPQGRQQAGMRFDVPGNPYQPPFARAMARGLDVGKPGWRAQKPGLTIPDQGTYGDYYSGGPRPRNSVGLTFQQQLAQGASRGHGYPSRYGSHLGLRR